MALGIVFIVGAFSSFSSVDPGQVGVRVNRLSGGEEIIDRPGMVLTLPLVHDLYLVDASPQTLYLEGSSSSEDLRVLPRLTVRASDGSNFWFERMTIQYQVIPERADVVLHESGEGDAYRYWLIPTVRSILRDEFGRQSTRDVSNPATYNAATGVAERQLNATLNPHGIRVINVDTPEPHFNPGYETTIELRNQANNQLRVIESEMERAKTERSRRLAQLDQRRNQEYQQRRALLEGQLAQARANQQRRIADARANLTRTEGTANARLDRANARAEELRPTIEAEIAQTEARIDALESNGIEAVMRQLARRLEGVRIDIQPYQNDPAPQSLRIEGLSVGGGR
jgi:membrane protease subunit HflC